MTVRYFYFIVEIPGRYLPSHG